MSSSWRYPLLALAVAGGLALSPANGQASKDPAPKASEKPGVIALRDGKIVTVSGRTIRRGTVIIRAGKIEAVGDDVEIPADAEVVDCAGKVITPGFIPPVAWGVGLASRGRGFSGSIPADPRFETEAGSSEPALEPGPAAAHAHHPEGGLAHRHEPLCLCTHLNWVYELQDPDLGTLERMKLFLPHETALAQASVARLVTVCHPYLPGLREQDLFLPPTAGVKDSLDPYGRGLVLVNASGITAAWIPGTSGLPAVGLIMGMVSPPSAGTEGIVVKFSRDRLDGMFVSSGRFLVMDFRSLVGNKRFSLRQELEDTAEYRRALEDYEKAKEDYDRAKARYQALKKAKKETGPEPRSPKKPKKPGSAGKWLPLFEKKRVLRVWAETVPQIRLALEIAERYGFELVIDDATEAWAIAGEVARARASVVLNPRRVVEANRVPLRERGPVYRHGSSIENAAILARHGVRVALVPPAPALVAMGIAGRDLLTLPLDAAFAVRGGLPRDEAIKAITLHPAAILGIEGRVGSLEPGKDADVLVLDGDPLDHKTFVERTYVDGRLVYDKDAEPLFDYVKRGRIVKPTWKWGKAGE